MEHNTGTPSNDQPSTAQPEETKNEQLRKIKVKTIDNQVYALEVPPTISIAEFKQEIEKKANVPADRQRLIYMAKVLHDEQALNSIVNEDDQTIHLLAKTQSAPTTGPQPQTQAQGQPQPQTQPSQQNDPNAQQNRNLGPGGMFFRAAGLPGNMDLGGIINGLIGTASNIGAAFGPGGIINLGGPQNVSGQAPQGPSSQGQSTAPTNPQQGQGQPQPQPGSQIPGSPLPGNPQIMGINFAVSAHSDPNDQSRLLMNQPQVRVISSGPLGPMGLGGQDPFAALLNPQQQQQQQGAQPQGNVPNQPGAPGAGPGGRTVIELPHRHVYNIGTIVNSLMGQSSFPGPPMPQLTFQRNALILLGGYLYNYQFQMMRLLPFLGRLADLLQRESLITNPNERHQVELLAHAIGNALDEVSQATAPVVSLFRNVQLGNNPGDFRLRSQQQQQQGAPQPVPVQGLQRGGPQLNIAQVLGGLIPQPRPNEAQSQNNLPSSQPSSNAGSQQQSQPTVFGDQRREDRMEIDDETEDFFGRGRNQQQSTESTAARQQQQQQPPRPAQGQAQGQGQGNIMGQMLGQMMNMGPGLMDQSIASFFGDREMTNEDDEGIMSILGLMTVGDFFALLTAGNATCFDRVHPAMKETIGKMLDRNGGSKEALAKSWAKSLAKYFEPEPQHQSRVMEGFEPHTVAEEITVKHLVGFIETVQKDYLPPHKFSDAFVRDFKNYLKELLTEISEGLYGGINDVEVILRDRFKNEVSSMAAGMEGLVMSMVWPQLWQRVLRVYQQADPDANLNASAQEPERELGEVEREEALLKEIAEVLTEDSEIQDPPGNPNFSEAYMKGDLNYEEKK